MAYSHSSDVAIYQVDYLCHYSHSYLPIADPPMTITSTVTSLDDGILRTSTGCTTPSYSLTLYTDSLKDTAAIYIELQKFHNYKTNYIDSKMIVKPVNIALC